MLKRLKFSLNLRNFSVKFFQEAINEINHHKKLFQESLVNSFRGLFFYANDESFIVANF